MESYLSLSEEQTKQIGQKIAQKILAPSLICLYGDMGSGKTTFTKGFAQALGIPQKNIKSPTYTFVRVLKKEKFSFYHYDFYRIENIDPLLALELQEIFEKKNTYILIEWPERIQTFLPEKRINIYLEYKNIQERLIKFSYD